MRCAVSCAVRRPHALRAMPHMSVECRGGAWCKLYVAPCIVLHGVPHCTMVTQTCAASVFSHVRSCDTGCCACAGSRRRRLHERRHAGAGRQHDRQHCEHYGAHLAGWWARRVAVVTRAGCRETRTDRSGPAEDGGDSSGGCSCTRRCAERTIPLLLGRSPRWSLQEARSSLQTLVSMSRCATSAH